MSFLNEKQVITFRCFIKQPLKRRQMEKTYEQKVNEWLNTAPDERSIDVGASLMIQGNRNRVLRDYVLRKNDFAKVEYELSKIIGSAREFAVKEEKIDIILLDEKAAKIETELSDVTETSFVGKRPDHETLPEAIKSIPEKNLEIYRSMRSLFEKLKLLSEDGHKPEERVPHLQELFSLEERLISNWAAYDSFDATKKIPENVTEKENTTIDIKRVTANRKYLSENKKKIAALIEKGNDAAVEKLKAEMQKRYNELIINGHTFDPEQLTEFKAIGLIVADSGQTSASPSEGEQINNDLPPVVQE
jgi:hypothetical protein